MKTSNTPNGKVTIISIDYGKYTENTTVTLDNFNQVISHLKDNDLDWSYVVKGNTSIDSFMARRIKKIEDANDIGFKEDTDYYKVGEGSIAIEKNEYNNTYSVFDARYGYSTEQVNTLTEARHILRAYLNSEKVFITSEEKYNNTPFNKSN